jgi:hypothetical protein
LSFWGDFGDQKQSKMSFWVDFWGLKLTDRKCLSKCHFGEISALQYMPFWGDFGVKIKSKGKIKKKCLQTLNISYIFSPDFGHEPVFVNTTKYIFLILLINVSHMPRQKTHFFQISLFMSFGHRIREGNDEKLTHL